MTPEDSSGRQQGVLTRWNDDRGFDFIEPTSLAAFGLYGADKSAVRKRGRRVSESTLHTVALLGGWPGALVAQQTFRHKTIKQPFHSVFWFTVVASCAALGWWTV